MADRDSGMEAGAFFAGVLIGGLVGAATALLMAPSAADETRRKLGERSETFRDRASDVMEDARERAETTVIDARRKAESIVADARRKAETIVTDAKERIGKKNAAEADVTVA